MRYMGRDGLLNEMCSKWDGVEYSVWVILQDSSIEQMRQGPFNSQVKKISHSWHNFDCNFFQIKEPVIDYRQSVDVGRF